MGYLEEKQIYNNINLAGARGKKVTAADGTVSYQLDDEYRVLEKIKNTPGYWRTAKYEMLAKLDNFGPFQLFFTLSCADKRWNTNFATILLERGYEIRFQCDQKKEDFEVTVKARQQDKEWKPLEKFLKEDIQESLHELIRGNVVTATRFFHHRVKAFLSSIVLNSSSPFCVLYYSYKVEFQERGAAHVHGVLWLNSRKLEQVVNIDGRLLANQDGPMPMKGLTAAFKKLKYNEKLDDKNIKSLIGFIDSFITVSTHGNTVGRDVAKIAKEVNEHHHTKTCAKNGHRCRFHYPKPPAPYTIIVEPNKEATIDWEQSRVIINKVMDVVSDAEMIEKIMSEYDKENEDQESYRENRVKRIKKVCEMAKVSYDKYIEECQRLGTLWFSHETLMNSTSTLTMWSG